MDLLHVNLEIFSTRLLFTQGFCVETSPVAVDWNLQMEKERRENRIIRDGREGKKVRDCFTMKEWISGFSPWHVMFNVARCCLPIVGSDVLCVCVCAGVLLFSQPRENERTSFRTNKFTRYMLEQISLNVKTTVSEINKQTGRPLQDLTRADSSHRWLPRSQCRGLQPSGRGLCRRRVDGRVQSWMHLKTFQLGTFGIALPLLDFGSAHKPEKTKPCLNGDRQKRLQKLKKSEATLWC